MFGGTYLSRHEPWTDTMIDFTGDSFLAAQRLKDFPAYSRHLVKFFIPEVKKIFQHFDLADSLISPVLSARSASQEKSTKNTDLIQWMLDNRGHRTNKKLSHINLHVAFAAIHTSAVAITHIVYDLCAMPEYVKPLREEVTKALEEEGALTKKAFLKMSKLDSFMRESQRFNPLLLSLSPVTSHILVQN
jgi:ent-kaurene oxidase